MKVKDILFTLFINSLKSHGCRNLEDVKHLFCKYGWTELFTGINNFITKETMFEELEDYFPDR